MKKPLPNNPFPFALVVGLLTFLALTVLSNTRKIEKLEQEVCNPDASRCEKAKQP